MLAGCVTKRNVPLNSAFWQNQKEKITIIAAECPKPHLHAVGAQGLLDVAIIHAANRKLIDALKNSDLSWYEELPQTFAKRLKDKQRQASIYPKRVELKQKNQANILAESNGDLLLTFKVRTVGARRQYGLGFVPMSAPEGYCLLVGELINPKDKKVLWHHEAEIIQKVQGAWDQPPHFQNFNVALNTAIAEAKKELLDSFFNGH